MPQHIRAAREALLNYIHQTGSTKAINGRHIFLQGSPVLEDKNGVALGRLSGIVAHYVPAYLQKNRMPSWETNCIEDWETKVDAIVARVADQGEDANFDVSALDEAFRPGGARGPPPLMRSVVAGAAR